MRGYYPSTNSAQECIRKPWCKEMAWILVKESRKNWLRDASTVQRIILCSLTWLSQISFVCPLYLYLCIPTYIYIIRISIPLFHTIWVLDAFVNEYESILHNEWYWKFRGNSMLLDFLLNIFGPMSDSVKSNSIC